MLDIWGPRQKQIYFKKVLCIKMVKNRWAREKKGHPGISCQRGVITFLVSRREHLFSECSGILYFLQRRTVILIVCLFCWFYYVKCVLCS